MIRFTAEIKKFGRHGEKTGWTYVEVPANRAEELFPGERRSFRVRGKLDALPIKRVALIPMGGGDFIIPLNADMRKALGKGQGEKLTLTISRDADPDPVPLPDDLQLCLADEPRARKNFLALPRSHRNYYIKWIDSARTEPTRVKRIAATVTAMDRGMSYPEMLRAMREEGGMMK
jgi:hypothetical protein